MQERTNTVDRERERYEPTGQVWAWRGFRLSQIWFESGASPPRYQFDKTKEAANYFMRRVASTLAEKNVRYSRCYLPAGLGITGQEKPMKIRAK